MINVNKKKDNLILIVVSLSIALLFFVVTNQNRPICEDCNVVIITIDALRPDHMGCYGYFRNTTPNIDRIAAESIVFENDFSQSSYTLPSQMSLFTSLYPSSHRITTPFGEALDQDFTTLPEVLNLNGYKTVWVGPLDDYSLDLNRGFERGFESFIWPVDDILEENETIWITENKNEKFFIFIHHYGAHAPYTPENSSILIFANSTNDRIINSYDELFGNMINRVYSEPSIVFKEEFIEENLDVFSNYTLLEELFVTMCGNYSNVYKTCSESLMDVFWENIDLNNESDINYVRLLYDAEIYEVDLFLKELVDLLERENLMEKTILVITADHGEEFMEHGNIDHGKSLYDEVIHVPLIIWIPGFGGVRINSLVQNIDLMPTILSLVGINIPDQVQGKNLLPLFTGKNDSLNDHVFSELGYLTSIRSEKWKFITHPTRGNALFDLENDPNEQENLVENETGISEQMREKIIEYFEGMVIE